MAQLFRLVKYLNLARYIFAEMMVDAFANIYIYIYINIITLWESISFHAKKCRKEHMFGLEVSTTRELRHLAATVLARYP